MYSKAELDEIDKVSVATRKALYNANADKPWQPTTRGIATPEPGAGSLFDTYEAIFQRELLEATPSVVSGNTVEHYEAVRRDVDRRRAEILAQANAIASRSRTP
jgi:hypothetical protein